MAKRRSFLCDMAISELPGDIWEDILCLHGPLDVANCVQACPRRIAKKRIARAIQRCMVVRSRLQDGDLVYVRTSYNRKWQLATVALSQTVCRWTTRGRFRYYFLQHPRLEIRKGFL